MIPGSRTVTITRWGKTFKTTERIRDWLDFLIWELDLAFPDAKFRLVQATYSDGPLSAGTHNLDDVFDLVITGADWNDVMDVLKARGAWGWFRNKGTWANRSAWHIHFGMLPPGVTYRSTMEQIGRALAAVGIKVGEYVDGGWTTSGRIHTSSQIYDYLHDSLGLKGQHASGIDPTGRPSPIYIFDWEAYVAAERAWKENPMAQFMREVTALCKKAGITRVYGARLMLAAAAKERTGTALAKIQGARGSLYNLDVPKKK